jgi:DNA-binding FadR family transcriptional regulator
VVSGAAAALAAERAQPAEVAALAELVDELALAVEAWDVFRRADARLHLAIASAARSPRLVAAETEVQVELRDLLSLIPHPPEAQRHSNAQHRRLVEAIAARDPALARARMEEHARGTGDFLVGLRLGQVGT